MKTKSNSSQTWTIVGLVVFSVLAMIGMLYMFW